MSEKTLELSEVIQALRENLIEAQKQGEVRVQEAQGVAQNISFEITNVDVELQTQITREAGGGVKFRFWVLDTDANAKYANATTHKIKLSLEAFQNNPVTNQRKKVQLSAEE